MAVQTQYSQGCQVTITVTTLDQFGHPRPPDYNITPTANVYYQTPNGPIPVNVNLLAIPITSTFYYINIDSMLLSVGSYTATFDWVIEGQSMSSTARFDIVPFDGATLVPCDPISRLRLRMKDMDPDPTRWIFSDQELSEYLQDALDNLNSLPARCTYYWFSVPLYFMNTILSYATGLALQAQAIKIASQAVSYNDRGISVNKPQQSQAYHSMAQTILDKANEQMKIYKRQAFWVGMIVTPSIPYISIPPIRAAGRYWSL
jgi:hypothetical protein